MTAAVPALRRREVLLAILLALLGNLGFFNFALGPMPYYRDLFYEFYTMKAFLALSLRQGHLPLWNPCQAMGMPFMADLATACFYPLNLLFLFLSPLEGLRYYLLLHYPLAGVGMYLLLRELRLRPAAAALGAMTFSWSGYLAAQHSNLIYLISPCYFPWALFCFRRAVLRASGVWALAAGLSVALPFLAGEPQGAAMSAGIGIAFAIFTAWTEGDFRGAADPSRARARPPLKINFVALLAVSLLFAAGLSMIQFLPSWELSRYSARAHGLPLAQAGCGSFYPLRLLELLWPNLWGLPWPENRYWGAFMTDCLNPPFALSVYLGLWPLLAATLAFRPRAAGLKPAAFFFAVLGALALLLAFGRYTPFYPIAYYVVPGLRLFRFPEKYLAVFSLGVAALAGLGMHRFLEDLALGRGFRWGIRVGAGVLMVLALTAWLGEPRLEAWFDQFLRQPRVGQIRAAAAAEALRWALTRSAGVALLLELMLDLGRIKSRGQRWLPVSLLVLSGLDLYTADRPLIPTAPSWVFTRPPLAAQLIRHDQTDPGEKFRILRQAPLTYSPNLPAQNLLSEQLRDELWQKDTLYPNWSRAVGLEEMAGNTPAQPERIQQLWKEGMTSSMLLSFNIKYVLAPLAFSMFDVGQEIRVLESVPNQDFRLLLLPGYFPRAYWVPQARPAATEAEAAAELRKIDPKKEVVLLTTEPLPRASAAGDLVAAEIKSYQTDRVALEVKTDHPGWLVLADSYFPGWQARVNGRPAKIYRANYLVRAVRVEAGPSEIVFVYRPQSYLWGRAITLATLGLALFGLLGKGLIAGRAARLTRGD